MAKIESNERKFLQDLGKDDRCSFTAAPAGEFTKIFPVTPDAYTAISSKLDELKVQHILFPERTVSNPIKAVIRGLPLDTPTEEILEELKNKNFDIVKITQMTNFRTKRAMPLFQIHLPNTEFSKSIFSVNNIFYYHVRVEPYNNVKRTIQCHFCQFYHHTQSTCKMNPRCVKCGESGHQSRDCPKSVDGRVQQDQIRCANCQGNHTASYRGCPKYPENRKKNPHHPSGIPPNQLCSNRNTEIHPRSKSTNHPTLRHKRFKHPQINHGRDSQRT